MERRRLGKFGALIPHKGLWIPVTRNFVVFNYALTFDNAGTCSGDGGIITGGISLLMERMCRKTIPIRSRYLRRQ